MATRIRTLNFLPEVFKTVTNSQFLQASLDQIVDQPNTKKIQGYVGSKFGNGINAKDYYVVEPTKTRTDYQLEPGVVFTKDNKQTATDFISYPGILDALKVEGALTQNNNRLFTSEFYSWDSFTNLDPLINFNQYYWVPEGLPAVTVGAQTVYKTSDYIVTSLANAYLISESGEGGGLNPTLTLLRGGTYTFAVSQDSQFWIQGEPGVTGYSATQPNLQTREVYGVVNNGAEQGVITFIVPYKDAQNEYNVPGNNFVDLICTKPFDQVNGMLLSQLGGIDGVSSLAGLQIMFYNNGVPDEYGYVSEFYDKTLYDQDGGVAYNYVTDFPGTDVFDNNYEGGFYSQTVSHYYTVVYEGDPSDPVIKLVPSGLIPTEQKITARFGVTYSNRSFFKNNSGVIVIIPYLSAVLDTLYYQDGTNPNKVGVIKLIESNATNKINVETEILGKKNYTAGNGVVFTNGLKVEFNGDVIPTSYLQGQYYVQGVGTAIQLIPTDELLAIESSSGSTYIPYDVLPYDVGAYDSGLYIPVVPDYITISRNSKDRNAWSRSNRWFHVDVINATATYNNTPNIVSLYATPENKAKRPIIEFYPDIRLYDSGTVGKAPVDFIDHKATDAFSQVAGQTEYYPDVIAYSNATGTIAAATGTSTTLTIASADVFGTLKVGEYIGDSLSVIPNNATITEISGTTTLTITVSWTSTQTIPATSNVSFVCSEVTTLNNFGLFQGARIIFAADTDINVRNKIYVADFSTTINGDTPVITLSEAPDGEILPNDMTVITRGYSYTGHSFYFDGLIWIDAQLKTDVNQPPLFDIFDNDGISLGNKDVYVGSSFKGTKLFSYGIGSGINDNILGFPIRYSSINNVGDISFEVNLNSDTFTYVKGFESITENVNVGYVHQYPTRDIPIRQLGWQTAVSPSVQYQIFSFNYTVGDSLTFTCDIPAIDATTTNWPIVQVYINNKHLLDTEFSVDLYTSATSVTLANAPDVDTIVQVLLLSDETSENAYYEIPINLNNNPLNENLTSVNVGDIRGQYQSIFYNNPNMTGEIFGPNNFRDLGNLVPWGNRIIQNSASLALPGIFLRKQNHNLSNALLFNNNQYIAFKSLLAQTVNNSNYDYTYTPANILDDALSQMSANKTETESFFWSDMLPNKSPYISNTYSFATSLDVSIYPLNRIYDYTVANYYGVIVYLTRNNNIIQLIKGQDYTISTDSPSLTITLDLLPGDQITINEYNQTYGSYAPYTPTKLGLYPATIPSIFLDSDYQNPTYFIVGHDGSFNKLYGNYNPITGTLDDYRDQALLEFEKRVYNNLKLSNVIPVQEYEVLPGFFRQTDYSYQEFLTIYSESFLNWIGQNRIEYKEQFYNQNNPYTYNYRNTGNKLNNEPIIQGYWRGIYEYFYDTFTPNLTPWEMIGYTSQPSWWESRYGVAPYTSDNLILWNDMANGVDYNNGTPIVLERYKRPGLLDVLPVDSSGNLLSPFDSVVGNYDSNTFRQDWIVGDIGPAELAFRRSSSWPFVLMRILSLTKPAKFYNLGVDVDIYKYSLEFNQYLLNNRSHLKPTDIVVYGNGNPVTSYINWIVDYEKQVGVDATTQLTTLFANTDVRLVYRLAGFSDKQLLKFYVEKGSPNSRNASLLIPDESYSVLLYDNQAYDRISYSAVVIQQTNTGYRVYGNNQTNAYFTISQVKPTIDYTDITIEDVTVRVYNQYYDNTIDVPYGTEFYTLEQVSQFLASYGDYLVKQGMKFEDIKNGIQVNWEQIIGEFLYWSQQGWEIGSIITVNPAAEILEIDKDSVVVQPLTIKNQNFVLNQNLVPINLTDLAIIRQGTAFTIQALNTGDSISYGQFNINNIEHGIVFDNVTLFNDIIYNLVTGLRQTRIYVDGAKTAEWNGTVDAQGFILNQDNITEWDGTYKYTKGSIVKYKNKYWTAVKIVQPSEKFNDTEWVVTDYNEIQKGLLPNSSTNSYESTLYYDVNKANLENDADLLSFSLIGYRPRDYLALADLTDITQVNVYQNMIKNKGTLNAASAFKGATLPQGGIDYDIYENWAIKSSEFGGVTNNSFIELQLDETKLANNPTTISIVDNTNGYGSDQEIPVYKIYNYDKPVRNIDVLKTLPSETPSVLFPDAGYVNFNDVKMASYYMSTLGTATNQYGTLVPLQELYVRDYVWLANYLNKWEVMTPSSLGSIINAKNNLNGTVTITFSNPQTITKYQIFAIVNFNAAIDGYYVASAIIDPYNVVVNLALNPSITNVTGLGVGFQFQSQRVDQPSDINSLPLLDSEFTKNKVWVDTNSDGSWAVFRKSINYNPYIDITNDTASTFGKSVAYTSNLGYLIGDSGLGNVYRYRYNTDTQEYGVIQTLTHSATFGSAISYSDDIFAISETSGNVYIYQLVITQLLNQLNLLQTIATTLPSTTFGKSLALSGDKNWLYVGDPDNECVHVYRKSQTTGNYVFVTYLQDSPTGTYGASVATDYYGETLIVGAPGTDINGITDAGRTYVYNRLVQNVEVPYTSTPFVPQVITLASAPAVESRVATNTSEAGYANYIKVSTNLTGISVNDPVIFSGTLLSAGAIQSNKVYYVINISGTRFQISETVGGSAVTLATQSGGSMECTFQVNPLFVLDNGTLLTNNQYAVYNSKLYVYASLTVGDILTISTNTFVRTQSIDTGSDSDIGEYLGQSVTTTRQAQEVMIGAPYKLDRINVKEGAVYRYTNGGKLYGTVIGTSTVNVTTPRKLLINGFLVTIPIGDATVAANAINSAIVTNVIATASNGQLIISLINNGLGASNNKLAISSTEYATFGELGINVYTNTQTITCPHSELHQQFGYTVKFNEFDSFVASAPTGSRYALTTFDFTDDELDNDTIFDNNTTTFTDSFANAGAVYMFDCLSNYNESIANPGAFVYAQSVNAQDLVYGSQPMYGTALDFNNYTVMIGTPSFLPGTTNGQVEVYKNEIGQQDWTVYRNSGPVVDIEKIENAQIYSRQTNNTLVNLDYIDPLQGKILGAARENIDYISNVDPASYNNDVNTQGGLFWGADKVGQMWFNTSNVRFINYHQDDFNYNKDWVGKVFPGSDVIVCTFVTSNVVPSLYQGPGVPFDATSYSVEYIPNNEGTLTPVYYYWVRNTNIIVEKLGKTLSDTVVAQYIANPQTTGISYFYPLESNVYGLYNCLPYINAKDSIFHLGFSTGASDDVQHNEYTLIQENNPDSFLPGLPDTMPDNLPGSLYAKMLDSLSGTDVSGAVVPDPLLPLLVQSGVLARPRQSFFTNRLGALQNYVQSANTVLAKFPINELVNLTLLSEQDTFYNTTNYWYTIDWWATGYNNSTKPTLSVPTYNYLDTLNVPEGTIVRVQANGAGLSETYIYQNLQWTRIGLQNGTIQISDALWNYVDYNIGFGGSFYDTDPFDSYPSEETRNIVRALNEQLPSSLYPFRNEGLILLFNYIQSESIESQNYLTWLTKTSLIDVSHTIRELLPLEVFRSDNQDFLAGYLNEVKPYHVVIKEFLFKYKGSDVYAGDMTDFDVPASYSHTLQQFIAPQLVYSNPAADNEFLPTDAIWTEGQYTQWINNYGASLVGQPGYLMTTTASYLALNTQTLAVDNASGFPTSGVIQIGTEKIGYASVDRAFNILSGLSRGYDGTEVTTHITGEQIFMDLPPVILLNGGRNYTEAPKVSAYIDTSIYPAPRVPAVLTAVMSLGTVIGINVENPGSGYAISPKIIIDPSVVVTFGSSSVNTSTNTILVTTPALNTGDLVKYVSVTGDAIGGLDVGQYYYINVLETTPEVSISLYTNYKDCVLDQNRVALTSQGTGTNTFEFGAIATPIVSSYPVRENNITLRFDRTTYDSRVTDWVPGTFYGSFFAGALNYRFDGSSSGISLYSTLPPISYILASAQGVSFEITDVDNQQTLTWSSQVRSVINTNTTGSNQIKIWPSNWQEIKAEIDATYDPLTAAGVWATQITYFNTTLGFYIGMPIKFVGAVSGTNLVDGQTYYVKTINSNTTFTVSDTISGSVPGSVFPLSTATIGSAGLIAYPGEVVNQAILTINYPGIEQVLETNSTDNSLYIPLRLTGQGGTQDFYTGLTLYFTGDTFGEVVENEVYYITSIVDEEHFTMSTSQTPITTTVYGVELDSVIVNSSVEFRVNDPIIFNNMQISGTAVPYGDPLNAFGSIVPGQLYYIAGIPNNSHIQLTNSINGLPISLSNVTPNYPSTSGVMINQRNVVKLTNATGSMTANINLPVSPGQINGQKFELYQTSGVQVNLSGASSSLVTFPIDAAIHTASLDRIILHENKLADAYQLYVGMPFRVPYNFDNLTTGTTYYVNDFGLTEVTISSSSSSTNEFTCDDATVLCPDMPIMFSNAPVGGIMLNVTYFVREVTSSTTFTISTTIGGSEVTLTTVNGTMYGKGEVWIEPKIVSVVTLSNSFTPATQTKATGTVITNSVVVVNDASIFDVNAMIEVTGTAFGGMSIDTIYYVLAVDTVNNEISLSLSQGGSPITLVNSTPVSPDMLVKWASVDLTQYVTSTASFAVQSILGGYSAAITTPGTGYAIDNVITIPGTLLNGTSPNNDCIITVNTVDATGAITSIIRQGTPATATNNYYLKVVNENQVAVYSNPLMTVPVSGINFTYTGITSTTVTALATPNITVSSTTGFNIYDPVVFTGTVAGNIVAGQIYYIRTLTPLTISATPGGSAFNVGTASGLSFTMAKSGDYALLPEPFYFDQSIVKYNNKVYRCIVSNNDSEFIFGKWELLNSGDRALNAMDRVIGYYQPTDNMPGVDLTQLFDGVTYPNSTYLGNPFAPDDEYPLDTILQDQPFYPTSINLTGVIWNGVQYISTANSPEYSLNVISDPVEENVWNLDQIAGQVINTNSIYYNSDAGIYIITTSNTTVPLLISNNGYDWTASGAFFPYDGAPYDTTNYDDSSASTPAIPLYNSFYKNGVYYAVGSTILSSIDSYLWTSTYNVPEYMIYELHGITYVNIPNFVGYMVVGKQTDTRNPTVSYEVILTSPTGVAWSNPLPSVLGNNGLLSVATDNNIIVAVGYNGQKYTTINGSNWAPQTTSGNPNLNQIIYANSLFVVVGDNGTIQTSSDGISWTTQTSGTTENLYSVTYNDIDGQWTVVGDNNTILQSTNTTTWTTSSFFATNQTFYNVQGESFTAGYGPEELVPGVVTDNLTMFVNTRPGTDWPETEYAHVGYDVVSKVITPTNAIQTVYSFANIVEIPAQIKVFVINGSTGLATALIGPNDTIASDYSIDWVNETITLNTAISIADQLRFEAYQVGNGNQLVKTNTGENPIRLSNIGFSEIYLDCNYTGVLYNGSGAIRPGTEPIETFAFSTSSTDNTITVADVSNFVVNSPIIFSGTVFGGVAEDTTYYVKTISYAQSKITISDTFNVIAGISGPTYQLTNGTGIMDVIIQLGVGTTWTDPIVYHNGTRLNSGHLITITKTKSSTDTVTCNSTSGLIVGEKIVFSNTMFTASGLIAGKIYYIQSIYDSNEFTVTDTIGGSVLPLNDATGGASAITGDYAFGIQPNGISATMLLSGKEVAGYAVPYDKLVDCLTYTVFGETLPVQYGYTVPETQYYNGDGSTLTFNMDNNNGGTNPTNAIVEVNGLRLDNTAYTISDLLNTITFTSAPSGKVAVTTYNDTQRQYFNTQYGITNKTVSAITNISNTLSNPLATTVASATDASTHQITVSSTTGFAVGATAQFYGTSFGGINVTGTVYFVKTIVDSTHVILATDPALTTDFIPSSTAAGSLLLQIGGQPAIRVETVSNNGLSTNDLIRIDGTVGSLQLNNGLYYVHVITSKIFDLYQYDPNNPTKNYDPAVNAVNYPVTACNNYVSGGYAWVDGSFFIVTTTTIATDASTNNITCGDTSNLISNTPIIFTKANVSLGVNLIGGIISGTTYYVKDIVDAHKFTISETQNGPEFVVTTSATVNAGSFSPGQQYGIVSLGSTDWNTVAGTVGQTYTVGQIITAAATGSGTGTASTIFVNTTQWEQTEVDRIYVTVNGYRVPSSSLRINPGNDLSILVPITSSDSITITSMMPSATPNAESFAMNVNKFDEPSVYRVPPHNVAWLTQPLSITSETIVVDDARNLVDIIVQTSTAPAAVSGVTTIGLNADKRIITNIVVYNTTTSTLLTNNDYTLNILNDSPVLEFTSGVSTGNILTITITQGNTVYIAGEQIRFSAVNLVTNTLSGLQRGVNGTAVISYSPEYTPVLSILSKNRLPETDYYIAWNPDGPLQISDTAPAIFLNSDGT